MPGKDEPVASGRAAGRRAAPGAKATPGAAGAAAFGSARDHAAIARLTDDLLPELIAKLGASGLGEIEVRQGEWKARLCKPAGAAGRTYPDPAHAAFPGHVPAQSRAAAADADRRAEAKPAASPAAQPIFAMSPAVGIFQPRKEITTGSRVRAGDRIGSVDVLGVREDVVAPVDGTVGAGLVEPGEAVEYGQELIRIELPENARGIEAVGTDRVAAAVLGEA